MGSRVPVGETKSNKMFSSETVENKTPKKNKILRGPGRRPTRPTRKKSSRRKMSAWFVSWPLSSPYAEHSVCCVWRFNSDRCCTLCDSTRQEQTRQQGHCPRSTHTLCWPFLRMPAFFFSSVPVGEPSPLSSVPPRPVVHIVYILTCILASSHPPSSASHPRGRPPVGHWAVAGRLLVSDVSRALPLLGHSGCVRILSLRLFLSLSPAILSLFSCDCQLHRGRCRPEKPWFILG